MACKKGKPVGKFGAKSISTRIKELTTGIEHRADGSTIYRSWILPTEAKKHNDEVEKRHAQYLKEKKAKMIGQFGGIYQKGSKEWLDHMDKVVKKYTGWHDLKTMCLNCPTLRISKGHSKEEKEAITEMREAYEYLTGKKAHPENWKN